MKSLGVLLLIFSVAVYSALVSEFENNLKLFSWTSCGPADPIVVESFNITPDPIIIPGNVSLFLSVTLPVDITSPTQMNVLIEKDIDGRWIKIPCIDGFGSCTYNDLCHVLEIMFGQSGQPCPVYFEENGIPCHCPLVAGNYEIDGMNLPLYLSPSPNVTNGDYHIHFTLNADIELICLDIYGTLCVQPL